MGATMVDLGTGKGAVSDQNGNVTMAIDTRGAMPCDSVLSGWRVWM